MQISYCKDYDAMCTEAASKLLGEIKRKPELLLCTATGASPLGLYRRLDLPSPGHKEHPARSFQRLRIIKLDEWIGVPANSEGTCELFLRKHLLNPLKIPESNYIAFRPDAVHPDQECQRIQKLLDKQGPIDICILGMGKNGHIGFNEPGSPADSHCRVVRLSNSSRQHQMMQHMEQKPAYGMTLGISEILNAKQIFLLVSGPGKKEARQQLLSGQVTPQWPVTFLHHHQNVSCLIVQ
jgi:galactosamine-6-phosphate isomerase